MENEECDHSMSTREFAGYIEKALTGSPTRFRGRFTCDCGKLCTEWFDLGEIKVPRAKPGQFSIAEPQE